jgi:hypothetical protein
MWRARPVDCGSGALSAGDISAREQIFRNGAIKSSRDGNKIGSTSMTHLPLRSELQTRGSPADRRANASATTFHRIVTTITNPELVTVVTFSAVGLLIALNVILRFPDLGALIEQYSQF